MGAAWDMLCSLDMTKLLSEQKDDSRIAMLVNLNRESCRNDDVKSFLEIRQEDLNNIITQIAEKHPKYKQFHNCCEHKPLTDIYELPGLFAEKKRELEIICGIALTNTAEVPMVRLPSWIYLPNLIPSVQENISRGRLMQDLCARPIAAINGYMEGVMGKSDWDILSVKLMALADVLTNLKYCSMCKSYQRVLHKLKHTMGIEPMY